MKSIHLIAAAAFLSVGTISCKKSGGGGTSAPPTESVLITITMTPIAAGSQDEIDGAVTAILPNSSMATWKVNGTTRANENSIAFTSSDFQNGVLTLETTANVISANLDLGGVATTQYPYTLTVTTTLNGKAGTPVSIPVTSTMQRDFTY